VGARRVLVLWSIVNVRVGVAPCWNKLALRRKSNNLHAKSQHSCSYSFRELCVHTDRRTDGHG